MSNAEAEAQARTTEERAEQERAAEEAAAAPPQPSHLSGPAGLDASDPKIQNPAGLGPENPHAQREEDLGQAEVQERMDAATSSGFIGGTPDPTPDAHYSLLTPPDAPTPETDPDLQKELVDNVSGNRLVNTGLTTAQTLEGAEPVEKAPGTKTPAESQMDQPLDLKKEVKRSERG